MSIALDPIALTFLALVLVWLVVCCWAIVRLARMEVALVSKLLWGAAIIAFPFAGLLAFLLLGSRTPQLERELGIRRT